MAIGRPDNDQTTNATLNTPVTKGEQDSYPTDESTETQVPRGDQQPERDSTAELVAWWNAEVQTSKTHWEPTFAKMRADRKFAKGEQWPDDPDNSLYVANICLRHVQNRVAALYAKRPTTVAKLRRRLYYRVWDGDQQSLQMALQMQMQAMQMQAMGGQVPPVMQESQAIVEDYENGRQEITARKRFGKTLEIVYDYNLDEQPIPYKVGMKLMVRRAVTTGVGYVKLGFVRATQVKPEATQQSVNLATRLANIEQLLEDMQDNIFHPDDKEAEELRTQLQTLQSTPEPVLREGLTIDYPRSDQIIIDRKCQSLTGFVGADWIAEEYILTVEQIQQVYGVDVSSSYNAYKPDENKTFTKTPIWMPDRVLREMQDQQDQAYGVVWEIYCKTTGQTLTICDGFPDFLVPPQAPPVWTERFWPIFALVPNDVDDPDDVYPPSDIELIRHQQREINRARQGLREHRVANRPKTAVAGGVLDEADKEKLISHPANAVLELNGLAPGQKVEDLLQPVRLPGIDPNLYETNSAFEDVLRAVGAQEADFGSTGGNTATESSIAAGTQLKTTSSVQDDFDQMLTEKARAGGQILAAELSQQTVVKIAGPGAVWPTLSRQELADEIGLEIEAGSSGRPNQQVEIQNAQQIFPLLIQIPGINPEFLARELLKRLDDRMNLEEAFASQTPSIQALNAQQGSAGVPPGASPEPASAPQAQGPAGASNAPAPPPGPDTSQGQFPAPSPTGPVQ